MQKKNKTKAQIMKELNHLAELVKKENAANGISSDGEGEWSREITAAWSVPLNRLAYETGLKRVVGMSKDLTQITRIGVGEHIIEFDVRDADGNTVEEFKLEKN